MREKPGRCFETTQHGWGYTHPLEARGAVQGRGDPYPRANGLSYASRTINGAPYGVARSIKSAGLRADRSVRSGLSVGMARCAVLSRARNMRLMLAASGLPGVVAQAAVHVGTVMPYSAMPEL